MQDYIKNVSYLKPTEVTGKDIIIYLKEGGIIRARVTGNNDVSIHVHDGELELSIDFYDIDYILGGVN